MYFVIDIEADALVKPENVWCIVAKNIETNEVYKYDPSTVKEGIEFLQGIATGYIGHNLIGYDRCVLRDLLGVDIADKKIIDTLVLSRLLKFNIDDGHSLEAWGTRLKFAKGNFTDFTSYSKEMLDYCVRDVELNHLLYNYLWSKLDREEFHKAIEVEHEMAFICQGMHEDGFAFDIDKAKNLHLRLTKEIEALDKEITDAFPPRAKFVKVITPRFTKHGTLSRVGFPRDWKDLTAFAADCPFSLVTWEPFNPQSPKQIIDRLWDAGWTPTDKTKGYLECENSKEKERLGHFERYGWKVNETNLATVPDTAPKAVHKLVERLLLSGRWRTLNEWFEAYSPSTGRIHASFNPIGTWTGRMSHVRPNLGNVATAKSIKYRDNKLQEQAISIGSEMRSLWTCTTSSSTDEEWLLVGTDAVGIQLRIFAHYINDKNFTEALISGKSSDGTDAHSINASILGCNRDTAKTFIYAFLLGAGDSKVAEILQVKPRAGRAAKQAFIESYPGLRSLRTEVVPRDARNGYFKTFDGRFIVCDSEHLMMAGYLQAGEMCIMKHANVLWRRKAKEHGLIFRQLNFIHDEWQTEVRGGKEEAELLGKLQCEAIREVGTLFNLNCPMDGETRYGVNWLETH